MFLVQVWQRQKSYASQIWPGQSLKPSLPGHGKYILSSWDGHLNHSGSELVTNTKCLRLLGNISLRVSSFSHTNTNYHIFTSNDLSDQLKEKIESAEFDLSTVWGVWIWYYMNFYHFAKFNTGGQLKEESLQSNLLTSHIRLCLTSTEVATSLCYLYTKSM